MSRRPASDRAIVFSLSLAALGYGLMQSSLNPLLPSLRRAFDVGEAEIAWLVSGFLLSASIATPIVGRLGDMLGRAWLLRAVMVVFTVGTILAGIADSYVLLLVARIVQGVGGALFPLAFGILRERLGERANVGAIGVMSSLIAIGSGLAVVIVGPIVEWAGFHAIFLLAGGVVAVSALLIWIVIPVASLRRDAGPIDVTGAVLMAVWLTALLTLITQSAQWGWLSPMSISVAICAVAAFAVWLVVERRAPVPVVNIRLMRTIVVASANTLPFLFGMLLFAGMVVLPAFVQSPAESGQGFSASIAQSGLFLLPQTTMFLVASLLATGLHRWPGSGASIVIGACLSVAGTAWLTLLHAEAWQVVVAAFIMGAGIGLMYSQLISLLVAHVPAHEVGSASGTNTNIRNIGGALGAQLVAVILAVPSSAGFTLAFGVMAVAALLSVAPSIALARARTR